MSFRRSLIFRAFRWPARVAPFLVVVLAACQPAPLTPTPTPTATPTPPEFGLTTSTATTARITEPATHTPSLPAPTATPTSAPTSSGPLTVGEQISAENADRIEQLAWLEIEANDLAWSPDGELLAVATDEGVLLLAVPSLKEEWRIALREEWVDLWISSVSFSPSGEQLLLGGRGFFQKFNVVVQQPLQYRHAVGSDVYDVDYSRDGTILGVGFRDGILIDRVGVEGAPWVLRAESYTHIIREVNFAPQDYHLVALGDDGVVRLWDAMDNRVIWERPMDLRAGRDLAFSPDGGLLAVAGNRPRLPVVDSASGQERFAIPLEDTTGAPSAVFSPDGTILAIGLWEGPIMLWDIEEMDPIIQLKEHTDAVWHLAFSPGGRLLASAGADGTVRFWGIRQAPRSDVNTDPLRLKANLAKALFLRSRWGYP